MMYAWCPGCGEVVAWPYRHLRCSEEGGSLAISHDEADALAALRDALGTRWAPTGDALEEALSSAAFAELGLRHQHAVEDLLEREAPAQGFRVGVDPGAGLAGRNRGRPGGRP